MTLADEAGAREVERALIAVIDAGVEAVAYPGVTSFSFAPPFSNSVNVRAVAVLDEKPVVTCASTST